MQAFSRLVFLFVLALGLLPAQVGQGFQVIKAEYGADNTWVDLTAKLQGMVRGEGLEFRVDGETLGDPLPGVQKTLRVRYQWRGRVQTDNFVDLAQVRLGNPSGFGGNPGMRPGGGGIGSARMMGRRDLVIVKAEYGTGNRWMDVTQMVGNQVNGAAIRMQVNNQTMGGDPAPANPKQLRVTYRYAGIEQQVTVAENQWFEAPVASGGTGGGVFGGRPRPNLLTVVSATYGEGNRRRDVRNLLEQMRNGDRITSAVTNEAMGGDPAPAARKTLQVVYQYNGQQLRVELPEGATLDLPNGTAAGSGSYNGSASGLQILSADYGAQGRRNTVTDLLRRSVSNDRLSLRITNQTMGGDPYPGPDKELYVKYSWQGRTYESYVREGATLNLPNSGDREVSGGSVNGGGIFGNYGGTGNLVIESATWGSGNRYVDVTSDVMSAMNNGRLSVKASNSSFRVGDPAVGADKELVINYRVSGGPRQTARAREGQTVNLP